jgi:hypothetical protein
MSYISSVVDPSGLSFRVAVSGPALPVDEEALKSGKAELANPLLARGGKGALVFVAAAVATIGTLYLLDLWVDH